MYSILTNNIIKGLLFIVGLVIITFFNYLLKNMLRSKQELEASLFCNILPAPFTVNNIDGVYNSPSLSSTIIGYTAAYLIFPMNMNKQSNPALIAFLVGLLGINGAIEIHDKCTPTSGVVLGALVGILFGILYYSMLKMSGNGKLAYFNEKISNNTQCSKPGKTQFRCKTYRGGKGVTDKKIEDPVASNIEEPVLSQQEITTDQIEEQANKAYTFINSGVYQIGDDIEYNKRIPLGYKCITDKDPNGLSVTCASGFCNNNKCHRCRKHNDCMWLVGPGENKQDIDARNEAIRAGKLTFNNSAGQEKPIRFKKCKIDTSKNPSYSNCVYDEQLEHIYKSKESVDARKSWVQSINLLERYPILKN